MNSYRRFVEKLTRRLPLLVLLFCVLQPLLDVIGYWQQVWGLSNLPTMLVRLCLLLIGLLLGFAVTDRKWLYFSLAALLFCYLSGHICACVQNGGYLNWEQDLTDQARTLVLPVTALSMISLLRKNPDCFGALKKGLMLDLGIILAVELLSLVTGTDPHTYEEKRIGLRGWFIWTSPQSAILSILAPLAVACGALAGSDPAGDRGGAAELRRPVFLRHPPGLSIPGCCRPGHGCCDPAV